MGRTIAFRGAAARAPIVALAALALLCWAQGAAAQCAVPLYWETIVSDIGNDLSLFPPPPPPVYPSDSCSGATSLGWAYNVLGGAPAFPTIDLDGDALLGPAEDWDGGAPDEVFGTIGAAISCTLAGGTVEIVTPGIYRETLTVASAMTIRAPEGVKVVLEGGRGFCTRPAGGPPLNGITITGISDVYLENIAVRGFDNGIIIPFGEDTPHLTVRNCRFEDNDFAGIQTLNPGSVRVVGTTFTGAPNGGTNGIEIGAASEAKVLVSDSLFTRALGFGVHLAGGSGDEEIAVHQSRFITMEDTGIYVENGNLTVTDTLVEDAYWDGIYFASVLQGVTVTAVLTNNRIHLNGRDGFRTVTSAGLPVGMNVGLHRNVLTRNVGWGINAIGGLNPHTIDCDPGWNVLTWNTAGPIGGVANWAGQTCTEVVPNVENSNT